ncbi:hypothetical protein GCM10007388_16370 [Pseudoduganella plicata]|uniref:Outer membrane protein assembly factor BamE n=1 Tax=Pseudoduganella plicata TaxID=321984 RepID=A0AA88CBI9_9BURK|nr:hypothetical protein GCM10007388_16370 [Pseudoduganella plicata]
MLVLAGCSSIERSDALQQHALQPGKSAKSDVVNTIGLPRSTEKSGDGSREYWYYTGKPISTSYFIPLPVSSTPYTPSSNLVSYADIGSKNVIGDERVALICVFGADGKLLQAYNLNESTNEKN